MASVAEKPVVASGIDVGDAARRRNVAAPQPAVARPLEADDKNKPLKKVCSSLSEPLRLAIRISRTHGSSRR